MYGPNLREVFESVIPLLRRYDTTVPNLVADVKSYFQNTQTAASMLQAKGKNERKQLVEMITNYQLMRGLIRLFKLDPMLAFSSLRDVREYVGVSVVHVSYCLPIPFIVVCSVALSLFLSPSPSLSLIPPLFLPPLLFLPSLSLSLSRSLSFSLSLSLLKSSPHTLIGGS